MLDFLQQVPLVLASASKNRQKLLQNCGLQFSIRPSNIDESHIKKHYKGHSFSDLAMLLAKSKAMSVSQELPNDVIIAADQLCVLDNQYFDKPIAHAIAKQQLEQLSGKSHQLLTAVCLVKNNQILWQHLVCTIMTMHCLKPSTIENYLHIEQPYHSCGSYHYEGLGKWLFKEIHHGDESTIIGLPLLALLNALQALNIVSIR
ncbi:Maf family protein [Legionella oakridgensis]|uniref:Nucleoside triphosphate pyrophosphatase n=2 Tax=Legionella oakridgensis TaxID=29423 RepID=W0BBH5_9GAMM|nr:nucleoside triphosphate pyrophosphatase [Legionella oakridgensis]AHE67873.1 protein MAF [Legionella oakridgensis ATCC 33761 = DSM 21215]ETO92507.1 protein MAF [Legionella oakridgensis RV-2-2007]KTD38696.1 Maf-like protein [Legionella oakridgensis]STY20880.1 septum formation protein [Legionella longbeachae]